MPPTNQLWPPVTVNRIIQTLIYRLASHPLIAKPPIVDSLGNPIRINKFRNFDGVEVKNPSGLTLSIYPYHYGNSDTNTSLTIGSDNAGVIFKDYTLGGGGGPGANGSLDMSAKDEVVSTFVLKLHAFGFSSTPSTDTTLTPGQNTRFEFNYVEWLLRQYAELVAATLRSSEIRYLPRFPDRKRLIVSSWVKHIDFSTGDWANKGNSVLHSASILWQTRYYVPREWRLMPQLSLAEASDGTLYIGTIPPLTAGEPLIQVFFNTILGIYTLADGSQISRASLNDPATGVLYTTLDSDLVSLADSAPNDSTDFSLYFTTDPTST